MLLDIIIPHYNESWDICRPFFDIINAQKGVDFNDFRITVIHDGLDIDQFPIQETYGKDKLYTIVNQINIPHAGVSVCRNYGLQLATAEWVCFCDCDDCYASVFSLMMIFHVLKSEDADNFDLMWNQFYVCNGSNLRKYTEMNYVFIHNKYYRRQFLVDHRIIFPENLRMSEDSAFNTVVKLEISPHRTGTINSNEPLYVWYKRPGSVTMDTSKWMHNSEGHFDRNLFVLNEYYKRDLSGADLMVARTVTDVYTMVHKYGHSEKDMSQEFWDKFIRFYTENEEVYLSVSDDKLKEALAASDRDCGITDQERENRPELNEWLGKIKMETELNDELTRR